MKSCRTCGTRIHLNVLPSLIQSLYRTPSSLMNIFCNSVSFMQLLCHVLCSIHHSSVAVVVVFCLNGSLISRRSSCSVISTHWLHPRFLRIFSTFATTKQSSSFRWLLFKLDLESLDCRLRPRILRIF